MHLTLTLLPFILIALGVAAAAILFVSVKREVQAQARRNRASLDEVLEKLTRSAAEAEPAPFVVAPRSGLNLSKRVQALRLHRRGEDVSHIAAALGVPRREVELLIRVQHLSAKRAAG